MDRTIVVKGEFANPPLDLGPTGARRHRDEALRLLAEGMITHREIVALNILTSHSNSYANRDVWVGQPALGEAMDRSERTARRACATLRDVGMIETLPCYSIQVHGEGKGCYPVDGQPRYCRPTDTPGKCVNQTSNLTRLTLPDPTLGRVLEQLELGRANAKRKAKATRESNRSNASPRTSPGPGDVPPHDASPKPPTTMQEEGDAAPPETVDAPAEHTGPGGDATVEPTAENLTMAREWWNYLDESHRERFIEQVLAPRQVGRPTLGTFSETGNAIRVMALLMATNIAKIVHWWKCSPDAWVAVSPHSELGRALDLAPAKANSPPSP